MALYLVRFSMYSQVYTHKNITFVTHFDLYDIKATTNLTV